MIRKFNIRLIAFFLLIAFSQKLGLRVWMHHWLHETKCVNLAIAGSSVLQVKCDCAEDALMPVTESPVIAIPVPLRSFSGFVYGHYKSGFCLVYKYYPSLKGPPPIYFVA